MSKQEDEVSETYDYKTYDHIWRWWPAQTSDPVSDLLRAQRDSMRSKYWRCTCRILGELYGGLGLAMNGVYVEYQMRSRDPACPIHGNGGLAEQWRDESFRRSASAQLRGES